MFDVKRINSLAGISAYGSIWKKLGDLMEYPSFFVRPEWVLSSVKQEIEKPYILIVYNDQKIIGILPLVLQKNCLGMRYLNYCGDKYYPDPLGVCCRYSDREKCVKAIKNYLFTQKDWDILLLKTFLHGESCEWQRVGATVYNVIVAPFLELPEQFDDFLARFKRKKRYNLKAAERNFDNAGGRYVKGETYAQKLDLMKNLFVLHDKRAEERGIISTFSGKDVIDFHTRILSIINDIYLRALEIDGHIVAVLYGFLLKDYFFYYQIAHDPKYRHNSLGTVLLFKVIQECCCCGVKEFNFLQGGEDYKWQWTKNSRNLYSLEMYNDTFNAKVIKKMRSTRSMARRLLKNKSLSRH